MRRPIWAVSSIPDGSFSGINGEVVADLLMDFLHEGRPRVVREAVWTTPIEQAIELPRTVDFTADLIALLKHWDVCSKEWIVRQYDHEVQARTALRPLVERTTTDRATRP